MTRFHFYGRFVYRTANTGLRPKACRTTINDGWAE